MRSPLSEAAYVITTGSQAPACPDTRSPRVQPGWKLRPRAFPLTTQRLSRKDFRTARARPSIQPARLQGVPVHAASGRCVRLWYSLSRRSPGWVWQQAVRTFLVHRGGGPCMNWE
ncbi:hypothetical protein LIA77_06220 [Sarocladium implicatum]|nr:hypothetical protein LIA77_06220 [Sarocladium implicatum]